LKHPKVARTCGEMCFAPQRRSFSTAQLPKAQRICMLFHFGFRCFAPHPPCTFSATQLPKVLRHWGVIRFWLQNALCAKATFTFSTCQVPKALCTTANRTTSKSGPKLKCFEHFDFEMCWTFWLRNVFRATSGFWSLIPPDGSAPAVLANPLFWPSRGRKTLPKHSVSLLFDLFAYIDLLSTDSFSCDCFSSAPFSSQTALPPLLLHLSISRKFDF
jgi:hypothetical protein